MNDPMEGSHRESVLLKGSRSYEKMLAKVQSCLRSFGIASLSEAVYHEPMWAHYAGNFSGMCVAYSMRSLLSNLPNDCELVRVAYSEKPPIIVRSMQSAEDRAKMILSNKALRWAGEREWRLISPARGAVRYKVLSTVQKVYLGSRTSKEHTDTILEALAKHKISVRKMRLNSYEVSFESAAPNVRRKPVKN